MIINEKRCQFIHCSRDYTPCVKCPGTFGSILNKNHQVNSKNVCVQVSMDYFLDPGCFEIHFKFVIFSKVTACQIESFLKMFDRLPTLRFISGKFFIFSNFGIG